MTSTDESSIQYDVAAMLSSATPSFAESTASLIFNDDKRVRGVVKNLERLDSPESSVAKVMFPGPTDIPLLPEIAMRRQINLPSDPLKFTEHCLFKGVTACVIGGALGFFFGALFTGPGAMGTMDPTVRQWEQQARASAEERSRAAAEAAQKAGKTAEEVEAAAVAARKAAQLVIPSSVAAASHPDLPGSLPFSTNPPKESLSSALIGGFRDMKTKGASSAKNFAIVGGVYSLFECSMEQYRGKKDVQNAVLSGFLTGCTLAIRSGPMAMFVGGSGFAAFSLVIEMISPYMFSS